MSGSDGSVKSLSTKQRPAVEPGEVVWLSASAGTGKTQVLSARVLRLLLQSDVRPEQILCLTFTKAGAAEMANRINGVLARWVRANPIELAQDLGAIGADPGVSTQARARTLFAAVLDCPGGGLRIDTIHAFAQWLLAAFPHEAGLTPGTRAMEDRDRDLLLREVLGQMLIDAERRNDAATLAAIERLSVRSGPDEVERFLFRCAQAVPAWTGPGSWQPPMLPRVLTLLGLPADAGAGGVAALCSDEQFDTDSLHKCMMINAAWKATTGKSTAAAIGNWLAGDPSARAAGLDDLWKLFHKADGDLRSTTSLMKLDESYDGYAARVSESLKTVRQYHALVTLAEWLAPTLELGRTFALAWAEAKERAGFIDFDDQIREAAHLLERSDISEWIRYKLDRRFDHVLVDEAQDTNASQWQIIKALVEEYFAGEGARGDKLRTLFVVGDYKQAIFGFQGTSPENFRFAKDWVRHKMEAAARNARALDDGRPDRELRDLGLDTSFRTARPILDFVDQVIAAIGRTSFGLDAGEERHIGDDRPGQVVLWQAVPAAQDSEEGEAGEETWLSRSDRQIANRIARQIRTWLDNGFALEKGYRRNAQAGDIMVLVRKRKELAGLIVARLHAAGVPVAGVDRLRLAAPLAVRDLMAAVRFAAQPLDDLNLACLLVSPLLGWSQELLLEHAYRPKGVPLWPHLRASREPVAVEAVERLLVLLARADYELPQAMLHWLLIGPWQGRRKLIARLGREAADPIAELLNAAEAYAASEAASLAGFVRWFDLGEGELKREAGGGQNEVRVMTVHSAKGLQAPIVILADAADNPHNSRDNPIDLVDPASRGEADPRRIPLPTLRKDEKYGPILESEAQARLAELQEHWRLLYVAMTRAEEALFIGGALGPKDRGMPAPDSWYARLAPEFSPDSWIEDLIWGGCAVFGEGARALPAQTPSIALPDADLPDWLHRPVAEEPRPPRPLAPSALGEEAGADPPIELHSDPAAARRGVLAHRLLERLPEVAPDLRPQVAQAWLVRNAAELDADAQHTLLAEVLAILANPDWADLFGPGALAEVPIAAVVGDAVIAGTIDRLLVEPDRILLVDFKTARRPPERIEQVPPATLRQIAAYAAALEVTYPGRRIEAALLYTRAPRLLAVPVSILVSHKLRFARQQ